jgi:uncharacterized protein YndB with AHSA1/START domain
MSKVMVTEELPVPAERVWELVSEFGGIQKWSGPMIEQVTVEGDGVGAVRTIGIAGGVTLQEELRALDDAARSFSYAIIGDSPLPVSDYLSTFTVVERGPNACRIEWGSTFEPTDEQQAIPLVEGIYKQGIAGLRRALGL